MSRRPPHPYARRHLAAHAAAAGRLDDVLTLETLPYLDEARLSSLLRLTEAEPDTPRWLLLSAWRTVRHRWSWDDLDANAAALDVAYLAAGGSDTPERPTTSGLTWKPLWVEWQSGGTIVAGDARGRVRIAVGKPQGVPMLATAEGWQIRLWDPATGQPRGEPLVPLDHIRALVIASKPGLLVAACDGGHIVVWDAITRLQKTTVDIPEPTPRALAVGQLDGVWVVAAGGMSGELHIRRLDSGQQVRVITGEAPVRDVALATAADGRLYVAIGYGNGRIQVYDVGTGAPGHGAWLGQEINALALASADRLLLAAGSADGTAQIWDALTGRAVSEPLQHGGEVRSVAVTTTGNLQLLATGNQDRTARVWYIESGYPTGPPLPHPAPVESVAFGEVEGRTMLATGCLDGNTRLWDPVQPSAARVASQAWLPSVGLDAGVVVTGVEAGSVRLWDRASGNSYPPFTVEPGDQLLGKALRAPGVHVRLGSVRGRRTLTTLYRGRAAAWDLADLYAPALHREITTSDGSAVDAIVTSDRALVASRNLSGAVRIVDLLQDAVVFTLPGRANNRLAFLPSPKRALLAVEGDFGVLLLDAESGEPAYAPLSITLPAHAAVGRLDSTEVLAALDANGLRLYDLGSGELTLPPLEMSNTANGIAWVRVGDRDLLVTAHFATVRVWNPRTGRKMSEIPFGTEIAGMAVHKAADDQLTVAICGPGLVLLELRVAPL